MKVTLTHAEIMFCVTLAGLRRCAILRDNLSGAKTEMIDTGDGGWSSDMLGAMGEMALCKHCGVYFLPTINTFRSAYDVPALRCNVRTRSQARYELIVREHELVRKPCVLVTGQQPFFAIRGWYWQDEAGNPDWLRDHGGYGRPAYFVPHSVLRPMEDLPHD
jgi:hypothetical protein